MGLVCGLAVEDDGGCGVIVVLLVVWRLMGTSVPDGCFDPPLLSGVSGLLEPQFPDRGVHNNRQTDEPIGIDWKKVVGNGF
ncbi:hypothetical protein L484_025798 [Morus notabilis]|uniref:Uncharacterized protein n=1 Tax=Morus notabilis TaxID=981085 RepID=W9REI5_9ROSA|nr:hypothetical protein L484_025798 [Morus notabilis]